jgi:hypothetical protein
LVLAVDISKLARAELILDMGLSYDGITPVRIRAKRSEGRFNFSDDGGAVAAAGVDFTRLAFPDRVAIGRYSVNVTRQGVVWLPGFARSSDQWLAKLPDLVARGSIALYDALLELDE